MGKRREGNEESNKKGREEWKEGGKEKGKKKRMKQAFGIVHVCNPNMWETDVAR